MESKDRIKKGKRIGLSDEEKSNENEISFSYLSFTSKLCSLIFCSVRPVFLSVIFISPTFWFHGYSWCVIHDWVMYVKNEFGSKTTPNQVKKIDKTICPSLRLHLHPNKKDGTSSDKQKQKTFCVRLFKRKLFLFYFCFSHQM